jgi:hypothetical protein
MFLQHKASIRLLLRGGFGEQIQEICGMNMVTEGLSPIPRCESPSY